VPNSAGKNMKKILSTTITTTAIILITLLTLTATPNPTAKAQTNPQLTINGLIENPQTLTLQELKDLPKTTLHAAILCVDFPSVIVEQGNWTGIQVSTLLETAKLKPGAVKIVFIATDGYSSGLTVEDASRNDVILAYEKDGQPLAGLRLVVPGKWGYKWVNQVGHIEVVDYDYLGFWESKGYSDRAEISEGQQAPGPINLPKPSSSQTNPSTPPSTPRTAPTPTPTQSTNPSPEASQEPTQTPTSNSEYGLPLEVVFAAAAVIAVTLGVVALVAKKRKKQ
jgi:DMSO/TMAO reductase YedYZ molybdopterin-dependent catalytic subunit